MEKIVYYIINQVLELDKNKINEIDDEDRLIGYGLTSLKAIEVLVLIEEELNIRIEAKDINDIQNMTLGSIKKIIAKYIKDVK